MMNLKCHLEVLYIKIMKDLKRKIEEIQMLFLCQDMYRLVDKERYIKIQTAINECLSICENDGITSCSHEKTFTEPDKCTEPNCPNCVF